MNRLNVRCCCQPQKILGTLPNMVGPSYTERYQTLRSVLDPIRATSSSNLKLETDEVSVTIWKDTYYDERGRPEVAYKADGLDLATLCKLRGFIPHIDGNATTARNRPSAPRARELAASDGDFVCPAVDPEVANRLFEDMVQRHIDVHQIDFDV